MKMELSATFIQEGINANNLSFAFLLLVYNFVNIITLGSFTIYMGSFRDPNTEHN